MTEPDFALDFMTHDLCRTATDANDSQFQSLHEWQSGLPQQKIENIFIQSDGVFERAPSRASSLLQGAVCTTSLLWEPACWRWRCISPRRC
ncbi:hypothetical protein EMIT0P74_90086 [Pseudomonas sp. IT-P74]